MLPNSNVTCYNSHNVQIPVSRGMHWWSMRRTKRPRQPWKGSTLKTWWASLSASTGDLSEGPQRTRGGEGGLRLSVFALCGSKLLVKRSVINTLSKLLLCQKILLYTELIVVSFEMQYMSSILSGQYFHTVYLINNSSPVILSSIDWLQAFQCDGSRECLS